jgi:MFS transporter, SP family, solute carrier family 2 (myo-inositol transporter), member 13
MINQADKGKPLIYTLTALSCIGGFLFGYDTGVISGAMVQIAEKFDLSDWQKELVVSITVAGALVAAVVSGPASDYFGRRPIILISSVVFTVGSLLMAFAESYDLLLVGRFIVGLGVGAASTSMPVFVSEAAPSDQRGMLVTCVNMATTGGQFIAACVSGIFISQQGGWRSMVGIAAAPAIIQFFGFLFLPESPRWLLEQNLVDQAVMALRTLRGRHDVKEEVQEILETIQNDRAIAPRPHGKAGAYASVKQRDGTGSGDDREGGINAMGHSSLYSLSSHPSEGAGGGGGGFLSFFTSTYETLAIIFGDPVIRRALFLGCALQAAQQIGGINTVMYYTATILKLAGFSTNAEAVWLSAAVAFCNFMGTVVGLTFVESVGRRKLTLLSLGAVCLILAGIAVAFYEAQTTSPETEYRHAPDTYSDHCRQYQYCFDCVQDEDCGYCTSFIDDAGNDSGSSACVSGDSSNPSHTTCKSADYYGDSCPGDSAGIGWAIFVLLCAYLFAFAPGMGCMPWCINSEIYPTHVRGIANSIATTVNWASNFAMSASFLTLMSVATRQGAFLTYAAVSLLFLVFFYRYLPETKGRELEAIQTLFNDRNWGKAASPQRQRKSGPGRSGRGGRGATGRATANPLLDGDEDEADGEAEGGRSSAAAIPTSNAAFRVGASDADVDRFDEVSVQSGNLSSSEESGTSTVDSISQKSLKGVPGLSRDSLIHI